MPLDPFDEFRSEGVVPKTAVPRHTAYRVAVAALLVFAITPWALLARDYFVPASAVEPADSVRFDAPAPRGGTAIPPSPAGAEGPIVRAQRVASTDVVRTATARKNRLRPKPLKLPTVVRTTSMMSEPVQLAEPAIVPSVLSADASRGDHEEAKAQPSPTRVARRVEVRADAADPDGDLMTFRWSAPAGSFADPTLAQTMFTCPSENGPIPLTIAVTDVHGAIARDTVTVQCGLK